MESIRNLVLVERCNNACDIYLRKVSSLSYAPNEYAVFQNGRAVKGASFGCIDDARAYIKEVAQ